MNVFKISARRVLGSIGTAGATTAIVVGLVMSGSAGASGSILLPGGTPNPYHLVVDNIDSCSGTPSSHALDFQLNFALGTHIDLSTDVPVSSNVSYGPDAYGIQVTVSGGVAVITFPNSTNIDFIVIKGGAAASGGGANVYWGSSIVSGATFAPPGTAGFSHWLICINGTSPTTTTSTTSTSTTSTSTTSTTSTSSTSTTSTTSTSTTSTTSTTTTTIPATSTTTSTTIAPTTTTTAAPTTTTTVAPTTSTTVAPTTSTTTTTVPTTVTTAAPTTTTTVPGVTTTVVVSPPTTSPSTLPPVTVPVSAPGTGVGGVATSPDNPGVLAASGAMLLAGLVGLGLTLRRRRRA